MAQVPLGGQITFDVTFQSSEGGPVVDPDFPVTLNIKRDGTDVTAALTYPGSVTRISTGVFRYVWTVPTNALTGDYEAIWTATIGGVPVIGAEPFTVITPTGTSTPGSTLGSTYVIEFAGELDPMYLDPDEVLPYFDGYTDYLEVAGLIHIFSSEVKSMLKLSDGADVPWLAYEYVKAATLCSLTRLYPAAGGAGFGNTSSAISLGDFRVESGTGASSNSSQYNRGNASDWCQLAEALRRDLLYGNVGMRAVVKASVYRNPIPARELKAFDSRSVTFYDETQGQLDGPALR